MLLLIGVKVRGNEKMFSLVLRIAEAEWQLWREVAAESGGLVDLEFPWEMSEMLAVKKPR